MSIYCKQINRARNDIDEQLSILLARLKVFHYMATFTPVHLVFLELNKHLYEVDFKAFDEINDVIL